MAGTSSSAARTSAPPAASPSRSNATSINDFAARFSAEGKIDSISEGPDGFKLRFKYWPEIYEFQNYHEVLLKSDAANVFRKPFKLLFSADKVPSEYRCPSHLKTKQHIIQCFGFPIEVTRDGATERYFYILEFVGPNRFYEFDGFWIKIKNGRFENISGYT